MAEEIEEIMARAMAWMYLDNGFFSLPGGSLNPAPDVVRYRERRIAEESLHWIKHARAAIAALHAHGYEIKKRDPDMLSIPEVSTNRPIGR